MSKGQVVLLLVIAALIVLTACWETGVITSNDVQNLADWMVSLTTD